MSISNRKRPFSVEQMNFLIFSWQGQSRERRKKESILHPIHCLSCISPCSFMLWALLYCGFLLTNTPHTQKERKENVRIGDIAQLVECLPSMHKVLGSNTKGTKNVTPALGEWGRKEQKCFLPTKRTWVQPWIHKSLSKKKHEWKSSNNLPDNLFWLKLSPGFKGTLKEVETQRAALDCHGPVGATLDQEGKKSSNTWAL